MAGEHRIGKKVHDGDDLTRTKLAWVMWKRGAGEGTGPGLVGGSKSLMRKRNIHSGERIGREKINVQQMPE